MMKVKGSAFYFGHECIAAEAQRNEFFKWTEDSTNANIELRWPHHTGEDTKAHDHDRRLFLKELNDVWCGVFLSSRSSSLHHHIKKENGSIKIVAGGVGENSPVEVNFFCIRKDSFKGIYSNYYGSYSIGLMLSDLWSSYSHFVTTKRNAKIGPDDRKKAIIEINKEYSLTKRKAVGPLFSEKGFEELLKEIESISEFCVTKSTIDSKDDEPISNNIKSVHKSFRFVENTNPQKIVKWLTNQANKSVSKTKKGDTKIKSSLKGVRKDGSETRIYFDTNIEDHLDFDYSEIGDIDIENIEKNPCLSAMINVIRGNAIFKTKRP